MSGKIAIEKLNSHPKNTFYFTDVEGEKFEEIKRSIDTYGIRDPLKVTTSYTIISGHQRYRIAKELGFTEVPVQIEDVDEWQAEYMLIAENVERRGQAETDPIKKSRIAAFLKEYWGVKKGNSQMRQNGALKTADDIAETIGEDRRTTQRLLKLNDLIPPLQELVSDGKLGTTAAEQLAYMTQENQQALVGVLGVEKVGSTTVAQAKDYREVSDDSKDIEELESKLRSLKAEKSKLEQELGQAKRAPKVIEKEVVVEKPIYKEVMPESELRRLRELERYKKDNQSKVSQIQQERDELEASLSQSFARIRELERLEKSVKNKSESPLYDIFRSVSGAVGYLKVFCEDERFAREVIAHADNGLLDSVESELKNINRLAGNISKLISDENGVVIINEENQNNYIEVVE